MTLQVGLFGRNIEISDKIEDYVNKKVGKLDRYLGDLEQARVDLAYVKTARNANDRYIAQITIRGKRTILRAEERASDIRVAIDLAADKMKRRIERYKGKLQRGKGSGLPMEDIVSTEIDDHMDEYDEPIIARRKHFIVTPMDEIEAIEQMNLLGHANFFVFLNSDSNKINVVYKRRDGSYGLIKPEIA